MINACEKCGSKHIIHIDNMEICDDCLSTIVYDDGGSVLSKHKTTDAFVKYYNSVKASIGTNSSLSEEVCKKLVSMALDIPTVLNMYGICLVNKGDYGLSIKYFKKAIDINPSYGSAYCNIARAYYSDGDYLGMLQNLERAKKYIFPEDTRYGDFLGEYACALAVNGKIKNAENVLESAEMNGFRVGDKVRDLIYKNEKTNASINSTSNDSNSFVSTENASVTNETEVDKLEEKKPRIENADISLPKDSIKDKIDENWKKWVLIAIGVVVILFIFSAKFRSMVLDFVIGAVIIGIIVLLIVEFIRDPVGFLTIVLSSAASSSSSSGGFATSSGGGIRIKQGKDKWGPVVYFIDGNYVKQGKDKWAPTVYYIDGNCIKQGKDKWGTTIYFIDGNCIKRGKDKWAPTIYFIDGNYIKQGKDKWGQTMFFIDRG